MNHERTARTFVLVGHCGADTHLLRSAIARHVPGADMTSASTQEELSAAMNGGSVLLINRVLDGSMGTASGIELIRRVIGAAGGDPPVCLLISNYPDAQAEAVAAGAWMGFGKAALLAPSTAAALRGAALPCAEPHVDSR